MNDLHHPCETWAERISLLAAGCLALDEEQAIRQHIELCSDCRAYYRGLSDLCGALVEARLPAEGPEAAIVERVMSVVSSGESRQSNVRGQVEIIHPTLVTYSLDIWRWIMHSPVSRTAAAAIFLLAVTGVALWFHGSGATPAFADFVAPILEAETIKFKTITTVKGYPPMSGVTMVLSPTRMRQEMEMPDKSKMVMIWDWEKSKSISLVPAAKQATIIDMANIPKENASENSFREFHLLLLDAQANNPDFQRERLGEKEIDGRRVVGYRITGRGQVYELWGDPKTGLPVLIEGTMAMFSNTKTVMSDFEFDMEMDESLFSIEPPTGYDVLVAPTIDVSLPTEKDLVETLRGYGQLIQPASKKDVSAFPDSLDMQLLFKDLVKKYLIPKKLFQKPSVEQQQAMLEAQAKLQRGILFAQQLPPEADAHYAGKGVLLGTPNTPIFWYRPKESEKYRVIYADLSIHETDTPPNVSNAQPVPTPTSPMK
ncbi:MAG: hypothetical protein JW829_10670 [Pirellulales bacterium]|nr:hypothetical protein [Pirellulales bacterium]